MVDRAYKNALPEMRRNLAQLREEFSALPRSPGRTDWMRLRIDPLLAHAKSLEQLMNSKAFSEEFSRLRKGVVLFHSDLVYLRENIRGLQKLLESERKRT